MHFFLVRSDRRELSLLAVGMLRGSERKREREGKKEKKNGLIVLSSGLVEGAPVVDSCVSRATASTCAHARV